MGLGCAGFLSFVVCTRVGIWPRGRYTRNARAAQVGYLVRLLYAFSEFSKHLHEQLPAVSRIESATQLRHPESVGRLQTT